VGAWRVHVQGSRSALAVVGDVRETMMPFLSKHVEASVSTMNVVELSEAPHGTDADDRLVALTHTILEELFGPAEERRFGVRLWNGETEMPALTPLPPFTLVLNDAGSLRRMMLPPSEMSMVEAYLRGDIDVEGDLESASMIVDELADRLRSVRTLASLTRHLLALPSDGAGSVADAPVRNRAHPHGRLHSKDRDAESLRFHYDLSNDFFALFLDRRMVYSCAYFPPGVNDIDAAQTAKLDHICRKLRLAPGDRLLDIGCGWGALVMYAAEHYGVIAHGVTLATQQAALAQQRIAQAGLQDRCKVEVLDYRDLPRESQYDKVSSVGMAEHVGRSQMASYFDAAYHLTREGGIFLNHCIVDNGASPRATLRQPVRWTGDRLWHRSEFIDRYVFPDFYLLPLGELITEGEKAGFEIRDVENLRDHYAKTCRHWVQRLERRHDDAVAQVGEFRYRVWRLYMAAGAHQHASGSNGIMQMVFAKARRDGSTGVPPTRDDLYRRLA
jgi:cyclopropane-fatty-acyl-phospholipid synthase